MTRLTPIAIAACLAVGTAAATTAVVFYGVHELMGWRGFWAFAGSHKFYPVLLTMMLFNNCVVLPYVIVSGKREKPAEPERMTPLKRQPLKAPRAF